MICDISLGDAQRPSGIEAAIPSITPGPNDFMAAVTLSVLVGPTATALTRTLLSANSAAQYRVSESIAAFAEPYSGLHHPLASVGVASRDQYLGALLGEQQRGVRADTPKRPRSGAQHRLALKLRHSRFS